MNVQRLRTGATVAVAAVALSACGSGPEPTSTSTAEPTASAAPTAPPFDGLRSSSIDDATALAHLESPRTGEVWHDPTPLGVAPAMISPSDGITFLSVGDHGDANIVVAVSERHELDSYVPVLGLFEVSGGAVRFIQCPSARTGDECVPVPDHIASGVVVDSDTFYDSMTYPSVFEIQPGYVMRTGQTLRNFESWESPLGNGNALLPTPAADEGVYDPRMSATVTTLAAYGDTDIVQLEWPANGLDMTNIQYGLRFPYGAIQPFSRDDIPGSQYTAIAWDDGEFRTSYNDLDGSDRVFGAGGGVCFPAEWSIEHDHLDAGWVHAGTTPTGLAVWVPNGPNLTALAVRDAMDEWSYGIDWDTGDEIPYPYATIDDFLAAYALIAIQRPDGEWLLGLRPDAINLAYECV